VVVEKGVRQDSWNGNNVVNVRTAADYTPPAGTHIAPPVLAVQTPRLFAVVLAGALLGRWWSS
jgi:hypothetical protein